VLFVAWPKTILKTNSHQSQNPMTIYSKL